MRGNKLVAVLIWTAFLLLGVSAVGQQLDLTGPSQIGRCEQATFTIKLTNNTSQTFSSVVITDIRPNSDFIYVSGSAVVTLNDGTSIHSNPNQSGLNLVWDLDSLLGHSYALPPGAALTIAFALATDCATVSGTEQAQATGTGMPSSPSASLAVEVLPGAVQIYKDPSVIDAHVGDTVTWTITVEDTGLGPIHNVVVTDALGSGLSYVGSTPAGTPSGQTVVWDSSTVPALAEIAAGGQVQLQIQAKVVSCQGLDDTANARFGCNDGTVCYDTAVDGGTATASIHLFISNPLLDFTPPDIQIPYCNPAGTTVTLPVTNTGDGPATNVRLEVNFPTNIKIENVQNGASWDGTYFHLPDLAAGESFDLTFTVVYTGDWCSGAPSGSLYWQAIYDNVCGDEFRPPAKFGSYGTDYGSSGPPSLAVSVTGDNQVYICTDHTYHLTASFSGLETCGTGSTGNVTVQVNVPDGFTVTDPGTGSWTPGGDGTGGTITWTTPLDSPLDTSFTLHAPGSARCGDVASLTATATATDCCGCELSASDSLSIAIECYQLVTATRQASPTTQEKCGKITYTNTYVFADDAALDNISFDELAFTESAANQEDYVDGSLTITIDGSPVDPITVVNNTPGGTFEIHGINDTQSVRGHTLVISYKLGFTADSAPSSCPGSATFYSWATLNLGPNCSSGNSCTEPCEASEALQITATNPSMSVAVDGLPNDFVDPCGTYNITVTLTKTSDFDPHNVVLQLENTNYYIVDTSSIQVTGVQPTTTAPTDNGTYYEWDYGDAFVGQANGAKSVLQFQVKKRCDPGVDLSATATYNDSCGYSSCQISASDSPSYMRHPLLYIYKTPETIYATENTVTWTIYVTNGGAGPAYDVWTDDILEAGLSYQSSTVSASGATTVPGQDHLGNSINGVSWHIPEIEPGATASIDITAELVGCQNLTDTVNAGIYCGGAECITPVSDTAKVVIPDTTVVATSSTNSPMPVCTDQYATITIKNAGDPTVYHLQASETLPTGISYVPGSTQWQINGGGWQAGGDPQISGQTLTWTETAVSGLSSLASRSTIDIKFSIHADCSFTGGDLPVEVTYQTVCGATGQAPVGDFYLDASRPSLSVSKSQISPSGPIDCGGQVTWRIDVTNNGTATADYVWVKDTLGSGFTYVSSQGDGTYAVDNGYNSGETVTWALNDLPPGVTATLHLTANDNGTCGDLTNNIQAQWGCGHDTDSSSATNDATCLTPTPSTAAFTGTRRPTLSLLVAADPSAIPACGEATLTLTITDPSTAAAHNIAVQASLPTGLSYIPGSTAVNCGTGFTTATDPSISGSTLVWYNAANLCDEVPAGGTIALRFRVKASCYRTGAAIPFTVHFSDCCGSGQYQVSTAPTLPAAVPALTVSKKLVSAVPRCGENATWQITVTNTGTATADWVKIEDTLGGSLSYVSSTPQATNIGGGVYAWELGPLAAGASTTVEISARLNQPATCDQALRTNTARVTWGCGTTTDGCSAGVWDQTTDLIPMPNLAVSTSDASLVCNGDDTYTLQVPVRNTGNADAADVSIRVYVDGTLANDTTADIPAGGSYQLNYHSSALKCGESHTFRVVVDENNSTCECDETDNAITLSSTCPCPALVTHKETVEVQRRGIAIAPGAAIEPGDVIHYRFTVTNVGGGKAFAIDVSDALPPEFRYIAGSTTASWPGGPSSADPTGTPGSHLSWDTSATLGPNAKLTLDFRAVVTSAVTQGHLYTDTMCATGQEGDGTPIPSDMSATVPADTDPDDCSSVAHVAAAVPALVVDKEIVDVLRNGASIWPTDAVEPGDVIHYQFTIHNVGEGTAYDVNFTDELPSGLEYDTNYANGTYTVDNPGATGSLGIPTGGHLTANISAVIAGGGTLVADYYARVTSAARQGVALKNYATATGKDGYGTPIPPDMSATVPADTDPDDTDSAMIAVHEPGLSLTKEIADVLRNGASIWPTTTVLPGDVVVYRVVVHNVGLGTAYNVGFTDKLPAGLAYDTAHGGGTYTVDSPPQAGSLGIPDGATGSISAPIGVQIDPGAVLTIIYHARVQPDALPGLVLTNYAEVTGDDGAGTSIPVYNSSVSDNYPDTGSAAIRVGIPALVTGKQVYVASCSCKPPSMNPGTEFKLLLTVRNVGHATACSVVVDDLLPAGLTYVAKSSELHLENEVAKIEPLVDPQKRALTWNTGLSIGPGETLQLIFAVRIAPDITPGTKLCDTMQATGVDFLGQPIPADASEYVPADTDPYDSTSLKVTVGSPPSDTNCGKKGK